MAKPEEDVVAEFDAAGVEAVLVAFDIESTTGAPPCTNEYVAAMRDRHPKTILQAWAAVDPLKGEAALDEARHAIEDLRLLGSQPEQPWHRHLREQRLQAGEIVAVDIEIWPSSTRFNRGEQLRLVIEGAHVQQYPPGVGAMGHSATRNSGTHVIHTGGRFNSFLLVPVIP